MGAGAELISEAGESEEGESGSLPDVETESVLLTGASEEEDKDGIAYLKRRMHKSTTRTRKRSATKERTSIPTVL